MRQFENCYASTRVLITGHTGFKGSWLTYWLSQLGAEICGISLDPDVQPNHWDLLDLGIEDHRLDVRHGEELTSVIERFRPSIVFHLAAQALVRRSYHDPVSNWDTNVMGAAHTLEACRQTDSVKAIIVVTTDKIYANQEWPWGYRGDRPSGWT